MHWPPRVGAPLPRAGEAWCERVKLEDWVLGLEGHGREWERVFRVGVEGADRVWEAIADAVLSAPVTELREGEHGVGCGVHAELAIDARVAPVLTGWHYADEKAAPRLVTAYPKPYTRGHGNGA
jgi:hypothetical protein